MTARYPSRGFPRGLHGRQEEADEHRDDRDDRQEFDEGEPMRRCDRRIGCVTLKDHVRPLLTRSGFYITI
jgi:hypothetical protein